MAATQLYLTRTGTLQHENRGSWYDKTVGSYLKVTEDVPMQMGQLFSRGTMTNTTEIIQPYVTELGMPIEAADVDPRPMDEPATDWPVTLTMKQYRIGVIITDLLLKLDRSGGKVRELLSGIGPSLKRCYELNMAATINTLPTTEGADGSFGAGSDHYYRDPAAGTWSNLETGASISTTSLSTMRANFRKRKSGRGFSDPHRLTKVFVPNDLETTAEQFMKSALKPDSSTNAQNVFQGLQFEVLDGLTSTTAWFGWGDMPESRWGLFLYEFDPPTVGSLAYPSADYELIKAGYYGLVRLAVGIGVPENIQWNPAT